jgi:HSP20 family protein
MADVDVKKSSSESRKEQNEQKQGTLQRQSGSTGISQRRGYDPFNLSLIPSEFFNLNPFTMGPFSFMRRMSEEMDRMLSSMGGGTSGMTSNWSPAIEVKERSGQLEVCADLPGMSKDDVNVEVTDDAVILRGERKYEHEEDEGGIHRSERRYGQFYRAIPLPEGAEGENAKAQFKDGVLQVMIPMAEQKSHRRQIPVEAGPSTESRSTTEKT